MKRRRKVCTRCKKRKDMHLFPPDNRAPRRRQAACRICNSRWIREHYRRHPAEHMLRRAVARAAVRNLPMKLTLADITPLPTRCPVFGFRLRIGAKHQDPRAFSLDRLDNRKGYVRGNVAVMSYLANRLKNDGTAAQHERIAEWMRSLGDKS